MELNIRKKGWIFTQSKLKRLQGDDGCPRHWFEMYVNMVIKSISSDQMNKGLYFEAECFGENAHDKVIAPAPNSIIKNGKHTAEGSRMLKQITKFQDWFNPKSPQFQGHTIIGTQVKVKGTIEGVYMEGIIDFLTKKDGLIYIWDLKFTGDVNNTFGDFGWGNYKDMDFIQQVLYSHLYQKQYPKKKVGGTFVLVMDASPKMSHKRIPVEILNDPLEIIKQRLASFEEDVNYYNEKGWSRITTKKECLVCPVEDCPYKWKEATGFNDVSAIQE